jgi:hypothetical protein
MAFVRHREIFELACSTLGLAPAEALWRHSCSSCLVQVDDYARQLVEWLRTAGSPPTMPTCLMALWRGAAVLALAHAHRGHDISDMETWFQRVSPGALELERSFVEEDRLLAKLPVHRSALRLVASGPVAAAIALLAVTYHPLRSASMPADAPDVGADRQATRQAADALGRVVDEPRIAGLEESSSCSYTLGAATQQHKQSRFLRVEPGFFRGCTGNRELLAQITVSHFRADSGDVSPLSTSFITPGQARARQSGLYQAHEDVLGVNTPEPVAGLVELTLPSPCCALVASE